MNPLIIFAAAITLAVVAGIGALVWLVRSPAARGVLPLWPPRDWRGMVALTASIAGAAVLTAFAWWLVAVLTGQADRLISELVRDRGARSEVGQVLVVIIKTQAWALKLLLAGIIAVLLSLGLAINKRTVRLGRGGFEASGGDDGDPRPETLAGAAAGAVAGAVAGSEVARAEQARDA